MHIPNSYEETRVEVLHLLMKKCPLGILIVNGTDGVEAHHLPMVLSQEPEPLGRLQCHVNRANKVWDRVNDGDEALVVFQGPQSYISPSWYPSKEETGGRVVPTWDYVVVHAHGSMKIREDASWLRQHLADLTAGHESQRNQPWGLDDAPPEFLNRAMSGIVGIDLSLSRILGQWKVSQNRSIPDRRGVVAGLRNETDPVAHLTAKAVEEAIE